MKYQRYLLGAIALCGGMLLSGNALAARYMRLPLRNGLVHELPMHPDVRTTVILPESGATFSLGRGPFIPTPSEDRRQFHFQPDKRVYPTNLNIIAPSAAVALEIIKAESAREAVKIVEFVYPSEWTPEMARELDVCHVSGANGHVGAIQDARVAVARFIAHHPNSFSSDLVPFMDLSQSRTTPISVNLAAPQRNGREFLIPFTLENQSPHLLYFTGVRVSDGHGSVIEGGDVLYIEPLSTEAAPAEADQTPVGVHAIPAWRTARGTIALPATGDHPIEPLTIEFMAEGVASAVAAVRAWYPAQVERPPFYVRTVSVGLQAVAGAIQLEEGAEAQDWTSVRGIGARASYGPLKWLSVEGALDALQTGDADLAGTVSRFTGGRLRMGALFRFGERFQPYARVGTGIALGSQSYEGRDSKFRLDLFGALGLGFEAWVTDRLVIGVSASGAKGSEMTSAEVGAHIAYSWRP